MANLGAAAFFSYSIQAGDPSDGEVVNYSFTLTGSNENPVVEDISLNAYYMVSILRSAGQSYLSLQMVYSKGLHDQVAARSNGDIIVERQVVRSNGGVFQQYSYSIPYDDYRFDRGPRSQSLTVTASGLGVWDKTAPETRAIDKVKRKWRSASAGVAYLNYEGGDLNFINIFPDDIIDHETDSGAVNQIEHTRRLGRNSLSSYKVRVDS